MKNCIFLIGYMGCGKTTVANILSKSLEYKTIDMDEEIQRIEGMSIRKIFMVYGEHQFRNYEAELLDRLCNISSTADVLTGGKGAIHKMTERAGKYAEFENILEKESGKNKAYKGLVVSCGGGIILDPLNCMILKKEFTVFLEAPLEILFERVKNDINRPLAFMGEQSEEESMENFMQRYKMREALYKDTASLTIALCHSDGSIKTSEEVSEEISNYHYKKRRTVSDGRP